MAILNKIQKYWSEEMNTIFPIITHETEQLPFYVTGIGEKQSQNHIVRETSFPNYQLAFVLNGEGNFSTDGKVYRVEKGKGFFFAPNTPHEYYPVTEPWTVRWIIFDGDKVLQILNMFGIGNSGVFSLPPSSKLENLLNEIYFVINSEDPYIQLKCSTLLFSLIYQWGEWISRRTPGMKSKKSGKIGAVLSFMEENFHLSLSLKDMADVIDVSTHFLCRLFKQHLNTTPFKYLLKLRVQKAKHLFFEYPELLVKEVSQKVGYTDISYFCSVFKEQEGITPSEFRKMHGIGLPLFQKADT